MDFTADGRGVLLMFIVLRGRGYGPRLLDHERIETICVCARLRGNRRGAGAREARRKRHRPSGLRSTAASVAVTAVELAVAASRGSSQGVTSVHD